MSDLTRSLWTIKSDGLNLLQICKRMIAACQEEGLSTDSIVPVVASCADSVQLANNLLQKIKEEEEAQNDGRN